ncbi:Serine/threonine protein kinase [Forsythia ovata]|uniref:Serine/threonine protein kinase n=1 Tax=Forsythia ovata TaxID=205694 RepID=A0ABD1PHP8_9LAMI
MDSQILCETYDSVSSVIWNKMPYFVESFLSASLTIMSLRQVIVFGELTRITGSLLVLVFPVNELAALMLVEASPLKPLLVEKVHCLTDTKAPRIGPYIGQSADDLTESKDDFCMRTGPWRDQGLCLVDWGRGIDLSLFSEKTKFIGDSRTSGFRCIEMQENKPWTFQVDMYGLCVIVHTMLHNSYMEIEKRASPDGGYVYQPKSHYKRYWNVDLWRNLFTKLLNINPSEDHKKLLQSLRESFQDYMCSDPKLIKKLKQLLVKQRTSLCSS